MFCSTAPGAAGMPCLCSAVLHEHKALKSAGADGARQPLHGLIPVKLEGQICTATSTHVPRMLCNRLVTHMPLSCSLCLMNKKKEGKRGLPREGEGRSWRLCSHRERGCDSLPLYPHHSVPAQGIKG